MSSTSRTSGSFSKFTKKTASQLIVSSVMISYCMANAAAAEVTKLPSVTVSETRDEGYNNSTSSLSKIGNLKDAPRTVTSVPRKLMDDQGVTSLRDALRNVTGVSIGAGEGGNQGDNFTIRGFAARGDMFIDGMRDSGHYFRDTFTLESVEVLKGPSSVVLGRGSTGGIINQQTKEAHLGNSNKNSITVGTNETLRATTDVNVQLSDTSAFRINLMANTNKVKERDVVEDKSFGIAPSLAFGLGTDTRFKIDYLHQDVDSIPDYGVGFIGGKAAKVDRSNFYGFKDDYFKTKTDIGTAKFEHDLNEDLSFSNKLRYSRSERSLRVGNPSQQASGLVNRSLTNVDSIEDIITNQTDLTAKFETLGIKHDAMTGVELSRETSTPTRYTYVLSPASAPIPRNPTFYGSAPIVSKTLNSDAKGSVNTIGVYVSDTAHLTEKFDVLGTLRYENIKSDFITYYSAAAPAGPKAAISNSDDVVSWSLGANYKLTEDGSIYASTGTSFEVAASNFSLNNGTASVEPEEARTYEVGTKWDFFKKKLSTSLAVFRTDKSNVREEFPASSGIYRLSGQQVVKGFEVSASGYLTNKWQIFTGYAYLDGEVKETVGTNRGARIGGAPQHSFNLFTTYKILRDVELGGGTNYVSTRAASTGLNPNSAPGYTTFNAMAKYNFSPKLDFQLNVKNLTNKYFYDQVSGGRAVPGEGRVFMLTSNFSF